MKYVVPADLFDDIDPSPVYERAFVILGKYTATEVVAEAIVEVPNRADNPMEEFRVFGRDVPKSVQRLIVGVAHTHPGGSRDPSEQDRAGLQVATIDRKMFGVIIWAEKSCTFYTPTITKEL